MIRSALSVIAILLLVWTHGSTRADTKETDRSPLVDAKWLRQHLDSDEVCILELGPMLRRYQQGHIPGAHFVHWIEDITEPTAQAMYTIAPPEMIQALLCRLGVRRDSVIVLYDELSSRVSTRMYWTLRLYGHKQVRILNGGRGAWASAGFDFVTDVPSPEPSNYKVKVSGRHRIEASEVQQQLANEGVSIIDGRSQAQFTGEEPGTVYHTGKTHEQLGHIPGAVNVPWPDNFQKDGSFRPVGELQKLYQDQKVGRGDEVIAYCNEGLHATVTWFVLSELLGYSNVRVYDESMAEWANDPSMPVQQGDR